MFDIQTDQNHYHRAQGLISAYDELANAEINIPAFVALIDALALEDSLQRDDLADRLDAMIPPEELPHFEWLLTMLTGSDKHEHRWYWDQPTGHLRLHGSQGK